jgi:Ca2+-binding EF-hand superfamily protein
MLEYFGLEEFLHTPLADRLFTFFLAPSNDPYAIKTVESARSFCLPHSKPVAPVRVMDWHSYFLLMAVIIHGTAEEKGELLCMLFDKNKDGWLDREELTTILIRLLNVLLTSQKSDDGIELTQRLREIGLVMSATERNNLVLTFVMDLFREYALKDTTQIENSEMYQFLQERIIQH